MPSSYPGAIKSFTTKTDNVDDVQAAHVNDLQLEVTAIETELGINLKGVAASLVARLTALVSMAAVNNLSLNDTTPTVAAGNIFKEVNNSSTSITAFDDAVDGQIIFIVFTTTNTTLVRSATMLLAGGANFVSTASDAMVLIKISTAWYEICRSVNA